MAQFTDVVIGWDGKQVTCVPEVAQVYYAWDKGADSVRWTVEQWPPDATRVEVRWANGSPWRNAGGGLYDGKLLLVATGNRGIQGQYKYAVVFLKNDQVVAELDPHIKNDPEPP